MKKAVIIKGNPKYVEENNEAERFYAQIKKFLENLGYEVTMDPCLPHTLPPKANLWIGHSMGVFRLRFAPKGVKTLALGDNSPRAINHPKDTATPPDRYHYIFTKKMKDTIKDIKD